MKALKIGNLYKLNSGGAVKRIIIEIINYEKFNPKSDEKTPFWFRANIDIMTSPSLFGLSFTVKWAWIGLLAESKRKKSAIINLDMEWAAHHWGYKEKDLTESIESLEEKGLIKTHSEGTQSTLGVGSDSTQSELGGDSALHTDVQTNKHKAPFDFKGAFKKYPDRNGTLKEKQAIDRLEKAIKTEEQFKRFELAISEYAAHCRKGNIVGSTYVLQCTSFVSVWEEWAKKAEARKKKYEAISMSVSTPESIPEVAAAPMKKEELDNLIKTAFGQKYKHRIDKPESNDQGPGGVA